MLQSSTFGKCIYGVQIRIELWDVGVKSDVPFFTIKKENLNFVGKVKASSRFNDVLQKEQL